MWRRLLRLIGLDDASEPPAAAPGTPIPYAHRQVNRLYNQLFCDNLALFRPGQGKAADALLQILLAAHPDPAAIKQLALDVNVDSRIRALAFNWLRQHNFPVPAKVLLGIVVELPLDRGLDVLAAYADGRISYINQAGRISEFEDSPPDLVAKVKELMEASSSAVGRIGPSHRRRLEPPARGNIRMTFVASDGLYFGEGPFALMQQESVTAPVIEKASELMLLVVDTAGKRGERVS